MFGFVSIKRAWSRLSSSVATGGLVTLSLLVAACPAWSLERVIRPDLRTLMQAEVIRVVNFNTLVVEIRGMPGLHVVQMIGIDPIPLINPAWTTLTGETPVAIYEAGQYLQTGLAGRDIYLEADPRLPAPPGVISAYVWQGQTFVNQDMLVRGHGLLADSAVDLKYEAVLNEAADVAEQQGRGVWTFYGPRPRNLQLRDQAETPAAPPPATVVVSQQASL